VALARLLNGCAGFAQAMQEPRQRGRDQDGELVEAQVGLVVGLLEVGGGESGDASGGLAVEEHERAGGPNLQGQVVVVEAAAEHVPSVIVGDEQVRFASGRRGHGQLDAETAGAGPGDETAEDVAVLAGGIEPPVEVGLGGGVQRRAVLVEPGQKLQRDPDLTANIGRGAGGDHATAGALTGAP